ncbi:MAG: hypothetical protein ACO1TE_16860 [Prosthecobacter sp.]
MQIKSKHLLTMLVMAGISAAAFPANPATITVGDLLFGFRVTGGTGAGTDLVVRADPAGATGGNGTTFRDASSTISSVVDVGAELAAVYGSDWATRSDLSWGVVGVRSASSATAGSAGNGFVPGRSPFVSAPQTSSTPGVQSSTGFDLTGGAGLRTNTSNAINSINGLFQTTADTGVGAAEAITLSSSLSGGWTDQLSDNFDLGSLVEASNAGGIDATGLDLYWILNSTSGVQPEFSGATPGASLYQGSFQISSSGVISFSPAAAVPEPSRTLFAGLGLAGLLLRRRRAKNA